VIKTGELDGCGQRRHFLLRTSTIIIRQSSIHCSSTGCAGIGGRDVFGSMQASWDGARFPAGQRWLCGNSARQTGGRVLRLFRVCAYGPLDPPYDLLLLNDHPVPYWVFRHGHLPDMEDTIP